MSRYTPSNYNQINVAAGTYNPSTQKYDSYSMAYWERALFQRAVYSIKFDFGDTIMGRNKDFIIYCLFRFGFVDFWNDKQYGFTFQPCSLVGYNLYYQPTETLISNPAFKNSIYHKIGKDSCLIKLTPDYQGIWDIIEFYAKQLSELDPGIDSSLMNSRVPFMYRAKSKAMSESIKKFFDKIFKGELVAGIDDRILPDIKDGQSPFDFIDRPHLKEGYITHDLLQDRQTLLNQFDREIGIPTVPYEKKERMVTSEADSTIIDSQARITIWIDCLKESFKEIEQLYGLTFTVTPRYEEFKKNEEVQNVNNESNVDRN